MDFLRIIVAVSIRLVCRFLTQEKLDIIRSTILLVHRPVLIKHILTM